jgi:hypothetical protein
MTKPAVDFVPTMDPLLRGPHLAHSATLVVLGIEIRVETNSKDVRDLAEDSFSAWSQSTGPAAAVALRASAPSIAGPSVPQPVHVRIVVHDGNEYTDVHAPVRYISTDDGRLIVHSPGGVAIVDESRRESLAYVTAALTVDREHFRTTVIEAITFALLACFDRHPIHAAAIMRDDRAVLLAGPSASGKSTLAYLAHAAGIRVLSDDRVWVQMEPSLRVWGTPGTARLTAAALSSFPELGAAGVPLTPGCGGKFTVPLAPLDDWSGHTASRAVVCALARGERAALDRLSPASLSTVLFSQLSPGFDRFPRRMERVVEVLTAGGGWRLTLTDDAREALPFLRRMVDETD